MQTGYRIDKKKKKKDKSVNNLAKFGHRYSNLSIATTTIQDSAEVK